MSDSVVHLHLVYMPHLVEYPQNFGTIFGMQQHNRFRGAGDINGALVPGEVAVAGDGHAADMYINNAQPIHLQVCLASVAIFLFVTERCMQNAF